MILKCKKEKITDAEDVAKILTAILKSESVIDREKEHFWAIGLNGRNVIKYVELVSLGTLNRALVHPRETFRLAIMKGVNSLIIAHNHPSGDAEPSNDDAAMTKRLKEAGEIIGIKILDHVIVTVAGEYFSFNKKGLL